MSLSWGNLYHTAQQTDVLQWRTDTIDDTGELLLPVGQRRSYGDVCINDVGRVLDVSALNRFIAFDREQGVIRCEAGVMLRQVSRLTVPQGWFLPVTPGTSFVTVGGAVANDVHGKNHHVAGTFGCFVRKLELRRSDNSTVLCSRTENAELFAATIGGLGLTGLITWVEFSLKPISNPVLDVESIAFNSYSDFLQLSDESAQSHEYCVAWIDCLAEGARLGAGVFFRGNHRTDSNGLESLQPTHEKSFPAVLGQGPALVNRLSLQAFNTLYMRRHAGSRRYTEPYNKFFYPLDALLNWNRIYGRRGFYQFQCVVPRAQSESIELMLKTISGSGQGSFLSVLKTMADIRSQGLIPFAREGITLALDFPNRGPKTVELLKSLEAITVEASGAIYPAKDAVMSAGTFQQGYPAWQEFQQHIDPAFSSNFWRRVSTPVY